MRSVPLSSSLLTPALSKSLATARPEPAQIPFHAALLRARLSAAGAGEVLWGYAEEEPMKGLPFDLLILHRADRLFFRQGDFVLSRKEDLRLGLRWQAASPQLLVACWEELVECAMEANHKVGFGWIEDGPARTGEEELVAWLDAAGVECMGVDHRSSASGLSVWVMEMAGEQAAMVTRYDLGTFLETWGLSVTDSAQAEVVAVAKAAQQATDRDEQGLTRLHHAVIAGDVAALKAGLAKGIDPNSRDFSCTTPLHLAALHNRSECAEALLRAGAAWQEQDNHGRNTLHLAAAQGSSAVLGLLLNNGADPNSTMWKDITPLHVAAWHGQVEIMDLLSRFKADMNFRNDDGNSALHFAAGNNKIKVVKLLIGYGADPQLGNLQGKTYLQVVNEGYPGKDIPAIG